MHQIAITKIKNITQKNILGLVVKSALLFLAVVLTGIIALVANTLASAPSLYSVPLWIHTLAEVLSTLPGYLSLLIGEVLLYYYVDAWIIDGKIPDMASYATILRANKFKIPVLVVLLLLGSLIVYMLLLVYSATVYG